MRILHFDGESAIYPAFNYFSLLRKHPGLCLVLEFLNWPLSISFAVHYQTFLQNVFLESFLPPHFYPICFGASVLSAPCAVSCLTGFLLPLKSCKWCTLSFSFARNWGPRGAVFLWLRGRRPMDLAILRSCPVRAGAAAGDLKRVRELP